jgi:hypothetical protein
VEDAVAGQAPEIVEFVQDQIEKLEEQVEAGAFDGTAQPHMQAALEESLERLKFLIER